MVNWDNVLEIICEKNTCDKELFYQRTKRVMVKTGGSQEIAAFLSRQAGYSIRVIKDKKNGMAFSEQSDLMDISQTLKKAIEISAVTSMDPNLVFHFSGEKYYSKRYYNEKLEQMPISKKQNLLKHLKESILLQLQTCELYTLLYQEYCEEIVVMNNSGLFKRSFQNYFYLLIQLILKYNGTKQIVGKSLFSRDIADLEHNHLIGAS